MNDPVDLPLRDIHLPEPVSWWPLPPGWWIVIAVLMAVLLLAVWGYRRYQFKKYSAFFMAKRELGELRQQYNKHKDARLLTRELSVLLRRLSISTFPREDSASLTGDAWLQHLDTRLPDRPFTTGAGRILIDAPYRRNVEVDEIDPLFDLCEKWIDAIGRNKDRAVP